jgi:hypothetical protein
VCNSFAKTGLFPFNISDVAIVPSLVTESKDTKNNEAGMTSADNKHKSKGVM